MQLRYNAPVTFSFALICVLVMLLDQYVFPGFVGAYLSAPGADFNPTSPAHYFAILLYVFGHESWTHLGNNFLFLLLLGPILEEKYAPKPFLMMLLTTTIVTGIFNILLKQPPLVGASSLVFMMIMLVSFARTKAGDVPVSFILIFVLFLLAELTRGAQNSNPAVSNLAHIIGGVCGTIFGFLKMAAGAQEAAPAGPPPGSPPPRS
ncbi:MAG: rhomboid family intramembrane serine protease [Spirochaetales bacterium]